MSNTLNSQGFDTGSNYNFGDKMLRPSFPRSAFPLSHLSTMTIPNAGYVFPIAHWRTVPSDEYDISVKSLLRVLPQVVPLYSRQRLYTYAFYSRNGDLWENWNVFARRGLSGNVIKQIPTLNNNNITMEDTEALPPDSLGDLLDLPIGLTGKTLKAGKLSALPAMMYMRIWRDYFFNKNFAVGGSPLENKMAYLFPDNDDHFRLNDDGEIISFKENSITLSFDLDDVGSLPSVDENDVFHMGIFPHLYPDDFFVSALPFEQRGEAPTLNLGRLTLSSDLTADIFDGLPWQSDVGGKLKQFISFGVATDGANGASFPSANKFSFGLTPLMYNSSVGEPVSPYRDANTTRVSDAFNSGFNSWLQANLTSAGTDFNSSVTLNDIRELTINQLELERMARTDGSYEQFGQTFFGVASKNAIDFKPVFIGGSYTSISFTEVLQTSQSSGTSALGTYAGHGIAGENDGYLGHCYCDDYGYIMILGCIMPDVYYSQGIDKHYTELMQSDLLLPDRAKLGMQPILNQEIYAQDYDVLDSDGNPVNEGLFAYQDIFDDYRYMANRIHGKIADMSNLSFAPYTQSRKFDGLPNWSYEFAAATDVRKDYLAAPVEDAYTAQFDLEIRAVRPLPYQAVPAQMIN